MVRQIRRPAVSCERRESSSRGETETYPVRKPSRRQVPISTPQPQMRGGATHPVKVLNGMEYHHRLSSLLRGLL
ncbi:hypothetical protein T4A_2217 [Trichinella pseudospiralis]|uniref:Uncharacterized protein n=1 Tax=Trichinella pseudospiralis TaxID=6337 RepID=A0A0V1EJ16_TRIPS|nr:hypothetical protein T4A_2217 [Trichinella pseudospiralis]